MKRIPIRIGRYIVHVRSIVTNKKPPIILVHGLGVSGDYYVRYAEALSVYYDIYIIDLPGYGKTPKPPKPLTIIQLSKVLLAFIKKRDIKESVLVGQSMGCQIVAHAAVLSPASFIKVILLAPTVNMHERSVALQAFRLWQDSFNEPLKVNFVVFLNYARMGLRRFLVTSKYMVEDYIEATLKQVQQPVLIVIGSKDKIAPIDWVNYLSSIAPNCESVVLQDSPHLLQYEQPEALTEVTKKFIE